MNLRISQLLSPLIFFLLIATMFGFGLLTNQKSNDLLVKLSGRQRMLSQKMVWEVLLYSKTQSDSAKSKLKLTMRLFQRTHEALKSGGLTAIDLNNTQNVSVPRMDDRLFQAKMNDVGRIWNQQKKDLEKLVNLAKSEAMKAERATLINAITTRAPSLLRNMNSAMFLLRKVSRGKLGNARIVQIVVLLIGFLLMGFALYLGNQLSSSIEHLTKAANDIHLGNVNEPIVPSGPPEVQTLGSSFERVRISLKKLMENFDTDL